MAFTELLNKSLAAGWLILAVILFRVIFRRAPKMTRYLLWALVAVRLACPISIESPVSLVPSTETLPTYVGHSEIPTVDTGFEGLNAAINPIIADRVTGSVGSVDSIADRALESEVSLFLISAVGTAAMLGYMAVSYLILRRRVSASVHLRDKLWICDGIDSPFILGVIRPRVYLPSDLTETEIASVEAHEMTHIRHGDHLWKFIGYVILAAYWWNPLVWAAYILFCRDIELCCDEAVIRTMEAHDRKIYSETLLSLSMPKRLVSVCPLAFGEVGVKSRVKSVLNYRKPATWVIAAALVACVAAGVLFLTDPLADDTFRYDRIEVRTRGIFIGKQESVSIEIVEGKAYTLPGYSDTEKLVCTVESADPKTKEVVLRFDKPLEFTSDNSQTYTLTMDLGFDPDTDDSMDEQVLRTSNEYSSVYYFNHRMIKSGSDNGNLTEPTDGDDIIDTAEGDINRDGEFETLILRKSDFSDHFSFELAVSGEKLGELRTVFVDYEESELSFVDTNGRLQVKAVSNQGVSRLIDIEASDPFVLLTDWDRGYPAFPSYGDDKLSYSILVTPEARYKLKKDEEDKWDSKYFETLEAGATLSFPGARDGEDVVFTIKEIDREQVTFSFSQTLRFGRDSVPVDELTMDFFSYDDAGLVLYDGDEKIAEYTISPAYSYNRTVKHYYDQDTEPEPLGLYMFPREVFAYAYENAAKTITGDIDGDGREEVVSLRYHPVMDSYNYGTARLRSVTVSAMEDGVGEYFSMFLARDPDMIEFDIDESGRIFVRYEEEESYFEIEDTQLTLPYIDNMIYIGPFYLNS